MRFYISAVVAGLLNAIAILMLLGLLFPAHAQGPTSVQQSPTELRASQSCNEQRGTGAVTATLTPPAGQYVYVQSLEAGAFTQGGTVAISNPASLTTTNLPGSLTIGMFGATANTSNTAGTLMQKSPALPVEIWLRTSPSRRTVTPPLSSRPSRLRRTRLAFIGRSLKTRPHTVCRPEAGGSTSQRMRMEELASIVS